LWTTALTLLVFFYSQPSTVVFGVEARLHLNTPAVPTTTTTAPRGGAAVKIQAKDLENKLNKAKKEAAAAAAAAKSKQQQLQAKAASASKSSKSKVGDGSTLSFPTSAVGGGIVMAGIEQLVKKIFVSKGITFPAQLASCLILLSALLVTGGLGQSIYEQLTPGTQLLTKWLPVFFVPGLAMLPLAPSVGSGMEVRVRTKVTFHYCC
jgi:hypothetical protein